MPDDTHDPAPLGLIAGGGTLPLLVAQGAASAGRTVACVGLAGCYEPGLGALCNSFKEVGLLQLGRWTRQLRKWGVREAIMVGSVHKTRLFSRFKFLTTVPDKKAIDLWYRKLRHDRRSQTLLTALADELAKDGITLIDSTAYITDHLATPGLMGRRSLTGRERKDIRFGWPILQRLVELDIGQAVCVKDRDVLAVEAIEGTQQLIQRTGALCRAGGWVLVKGADAEKDLRFDVPTVGVDTITDARAAGASCLALRAGQVIMLDKPRVIEAADQAGIALIGVDPNADDPA